MTAQPTEPPSDCQLCPRLAAFRTEWRANEPGWFNAPVPTFGTIDARLLVVGLAPGLRGANRTGRPFTGDFAGDLLYRTLLRFGLAKGSYEARPDDGFTLIDTAVSNAVRCVPPQNKPSPAEIGNCRPFLEATIRSMPRLAAILTLGKIAHDSVAKAVGLPRSARFAHGAMHSADSGIAVFVSYHCSRLNTNTGRLTEAMFAEVIGDIRQHLDSR